MLKTIIWNELNSKQKKEILQRPALASSNDLIEKTTKIIATVRAEGDMALRKFTEQFDKVVLTQMLVTDEEFKTAEQTLDAEAKSAIQFASKNIERFHMAQMPKAFSVTTCAGVTCEMQYRPIERVGLYVPGGTAKLPSTILMLGIPSKIAGCAERILCTPPNAAGEVDPHILYAAQYCGFNKIYKVGGAQAIAAMAYGTETIPKVDKIYGPGNSWVTQAKILVGQDAAGAAYDMPAGPSEQMVIADKQANPRFIAADLLSQAEHSHDAQVMLLSDNLALIEQVQAEIAVQLRSLPRQDIAKQALANSFAILVKNIEQAINVSNQYAPEHLILQVNNPRIWIEKVQSAGSVFLGPWSPESVGDYASGTNHALPTYGYARSFSGLSVFSFLKQITFQELSYEGLKNISTAVSKLAEIEGLTAHQRAVTIRVEETENVCIN